MEEKRAENNKQWRAEDEGRGRVMERSGRCVRSFYCGRYSEVQSMVTCLLRACVHTYVHSMSLGRRQRIAEDDDGVSTTTDDHGRGAGRRGVQSCLPGGRAWEWAIGYPRTESCGLPSPITHSLQLQPSPSAPSKRAATLGPEEKHTQYLCECRRSR